MAHHKWNGKITRKNRFVTCTKCSCIKQTSLIGYIYINNGQNTPQLKAPNCIKTN